MCCGILLLTTVDDADAVTWFVVIVVCRRRLLWSDSPVNGLDLPINTFSCTVGLKLSQANYYIKSSAAAAALCKEASFRLPFVLPGDGCVCVCSYIRSRAHGSR